jgi:hypothetical protein
MMKSLTYVAAAAAACAVAAWQAPKAEAQSAPPIAVQSCSIMQAVRSPRPWGFWYPWPRAGYAPYTDGLDISYVNTTNQPIDRVLFVVNYRGDKERIVDVGTFSPNATINHQFGDFIGDAYIGSKPNSCRVAAVRFTNGNVWRAR